MNSVKSYLSVDIKKECNLLFAFVRVDWKLVFNYSECTLLAEICPWCHFVYSNLSTTLFCCLLVVDLMLWSLTNAGTPLSYSILSASYFCESSSITDLFTVVKALQ